MENRVCRLLGCKYPVIEGGLAYVGNGLLAAAVSEAGGFGQVGSGGRTAEDFDRQIQLAIQHTNAPFGVNIPISEHRDPKDYFEVVKKHAASIRAVSLSAGNPRPLVGPLKEAGMIVMTLASTPEQARKAEAAGADLVICEGTEAGGHNGPAELTTMVLIPLVSDVVSIPIVAAGGIADGRTAAAAFCLGAEGVQMGTRFVATEECQAHNHYKRALVDARAEDSVVMERSLGHVTRVLRSPFVEQIWEQERQTPGDIETLLPMISGKRNAQAALEGDLDHGWLNCGQSTGFVQDVQPAGVVLRKVVQETASRLQEIDLRCRSWLQ